MSDSSRGPVTFLGRRYASVEDLADNLFGEPVVISLEIGRGHRRRVRRLLEQARFMGHQFEWHESWNFVRGEVLIKGRDAMVVAEMMVENLPCRWDNE